jgi:hypothetical protein
LRLPKRFFWIFAAGAGGTLVVATLTWRVWRREPLMCGSNAEFCSGGKCPMTWREAQTGEPWCSEKPFPRSKVIVGEGCGAFNVLGTRGVDGGDVYYYDAGTLALVGSRSFGMGDSFCRGSVPALDQRCSSERIVCNHWDR